MRKASRRWHSSKTHPLRRGWYEVRAVDNRWEGKTNWRAWGCGQWWTQFPDGWMGLPEWEGQYQWRELRKNINLDYAEVVTLEAKNDQKFMGLMPRPLGRLYNR